MDCRGSGKRKLIVATYSVKPEAHLRLLDGTQKMSDAGREIKNEYYIFKAEYDGTCEFIECGMTAARHFLGLLHHKGLPIFNPLCGSGSSGGTGGVSSSTGPKFHEESQQLYNAIMWVITLLSAKPSTPIFDIKQKIEIFGYKAPFDSEIKGVNKIIKGSFGTTLTEKINEKRTKNKIRDELCKFDLLEARLNTLHIESYF